MSTRESKVEYAKDAEQAERYDDMLRAIHEVAEMPGELSTEERNLLSMAYKNVIGARRSSWRVLLSIVDQKDEEENSAKVEAQKMLLIAVEVELNKICEDILSLLDKTLIPSAQSKECKVFFLKMKGDYKRYLAEVATGKDRSEAAEESLIAYKLASEIANAELPPTNPVRLGLALNFSVFYYEIINNPEQARKLAREAYNDAHEDRRPDDNYKDSALIMQLLKDNLTVWESDAQVEGQC